MRIGFLLTHPPHTREYDQCMNLIQENMEQGNDISIFADVEGVVGGVADQLKVAHPELYGLNDLIQKGVDVTLCRVCLIERGIHEQPNVVTWARLGDLGDLSTMVANCDKIISL
jgi:sulfur relay (sulfurtransferase) complex TusBCD TusD component (DsrE family)